MKSTHIPQKYHLIFIACLLVASCKSGADNWQKLDFGAFTIKTPKGWSKFDLPGIDTYYGGLTNGKDTLEFNLGMYGVSLDEAFRQAYRSASDTVNGLPAVFMISDSGDNPMIAFSIPQVSEDLKFNSWSYSLKALDTILKIYKTIQFEHSDPSKNPELTSSRFIHHEDGSGRILFYNNCTMCHGIHTNIPGPPLGDMVAKRTGEWMYAFLRTDHRKTFPRLTKDDVGLIVDFIKTH